MKGWRKSGEFSDRLTIRKATGNFAPMAAFNKVGLPRFFAGALISTLILYAGHAGADDAVRCDGKLMMVGQSRIEVLKYCGEPQDRLAYLDERVTHTRLSNFQQGMTQFTRSTGSYVETSRDTVVSTPATTPVATDRNTKQGGVTTLPQTHTHDETRVTQNNTETVSGSYITLSTFWECKKVSVYVDEYVYNFGSGKFLTFVRFENGRVRSIKYGEYGF
jgi:Protein of unknown function (DUF2845)